MGQQEEEDAMRDNIRKHLSTLSDEELRAVVESAPLNAGPDELDKTIDAITNQLKKAADEIFQCNAMMKLEQPSPRELSDLVLRSHASEFKTLKDALFARWMKVESA